MQKAKDFLSRLFYNKFFWQLIIALLMLGSAIFFIDNNHLELYKIKGLLRRSNWFYVLLGIGVTGVYLILQGLMYKHSFKALKQELRLFASIRLFLKRNLVSIFLPAGGFSSLFFFNKEVEEKGVSKSSIHLASTLFAFIGILSVIVVAIPILIVAFFKYQLGNTEVIGFITLLVITMAILGFIFSISKKGFAYNWLVQIKPSLGLVLDEMIAQEINRKQVIITLFISVLIEFVGIFHLYIAMLALGFAASLPAAVLGYICMVILLIISPFLRGLGAIEVSITYILSQFGFPVLAAAAITLLFRFFEFWLPLIAGIFSFIGRKDNLLLRILPACIIFILGIVNILSSITPAIPARMRLLRDLLPPELISTSTGLVLVFGLLLVILSVFLWKGSKRAWTIGLFLTSFSLAGHLLKGADYEEATLAFIALSILFYTRSFYKLKPHPRFTHISYLVLFYSVIALFAFGIMGFYFIDKRHFGHEFQLWPSVKMIFRMFFLFDDSGLHPQTRFAQNFIYAIYTAGGIVLSFIFYSLLRPYFSSPYNSEEEKNLAQDLVEKYGNSALCYFKSYADKFFFFSEDRQGFISFKITKHFAMVLGDPVCKDNTAFRQLVEDFDDFCEENGFISVFYRVPFQSLETYKELGKKSIPVGEEAIVNLPSFTLEGGKMKTTRSAINRLSGEGMEIKTYLPPIKEGMLQKLEQVSDEWLEELDQKEIAFSQGIFDPDILKNQTIITVENKEEKIFAFLNLVPDYSPGEATYDLVRKTTDAPNGVLDMLLAKTFLYLKEQGYEKVNMGLAPLSGMEGVNITEKAVKYAYENLKAFGHFKGLRRYKDKFFPVWEPRYLIYSHNYHLLQVPNALKKIS
ncbi:MAG: phosphatidylglycerol lysyltransferase domain-containing protein [Gillisia sp.]